MTVSLTKEEFVNRYMERIYMIKFPQPEELTKPIATTSQVGNNTKIETDLNEVVGIYIRNMIDVVYQAP
jgi:hypothetical protein